MHLIELSEHELHSNYELVKFLLSFHNWLDIRLLLDMFVYGLKFTQITLHNKIQTDYYFLVLT